VATLSFALGLALIGPAMAQQGMTAGNEVLRGEGAAGRYTMHPADGGYLRLDTRTGQTSYCARVDGRWHCDAIGEERSALQQELERLAQENRDLKQAVKNLEEMIGLGSSGDGDKRADRGNGPKLQLPTEEDVDRALSYAQRMLKKFKEKIRELTEEGKGTPL
jgi:hypothetical protein